MDETETKTARVFDKFLKVNPKWTRHGNVCKFILSAHEIEVGFVYITSRYVILYVHLKDGSTDTQRLETPIDECTFFQVAKDFVKSKCPVHKLIPFVDPFALPFVLK